MLQNLLNSTANVQSPTSSKGTSGGEKVTWTTTVSGMPCRVIDASASWKVIYLQRQLDITHQVFTNAKPIIKAGYQLIWNSKTLRVIGVVDLGGAGQVTRIDCSELFTGV